MKQRESGRGRERGRREREREDREERERGEREERREREIKRTSIRLAKASEWQFPLRERDVEGGAIRIVPRPCERERGRGRERERGRGTERERVCERWRVR